MSKAMVITDATDGVQLATPADAARLVGRSARTIYHWIKANRVRVRYAQGGQVLVEVASLFTTERPNNARVGTQKTDGGDLQPAA